VRGFASRGLAPGHRVAVLAQNFRRVLERKPEKELIKPGGENVYPAEVETVIMTIEGVTGVCVFGVPDPKWGEGIKTVVETGRTDLTAEAVREHVGGGSRGAGGRGMWSSRAPCRATMATESTALQ
jgi:acyl-coenzyme A synthetase/AMP-(fatty) acid ligase